MNVVYKEDFSLTLSVLPGVSKGQVDISMKYYYYYHNYLWVTHIGNANGIYALWFGCNKPPQTSRTFLRILAVCITALFWSSTIFVSFPRSCNPFFNFLGIAPNAPMTTGVTVSFIFQIFFSSLARS